MTPPPRKEPLQRWLAWVAAALAGIVGMVYGYDFGNRLGGALLGVVMALNGAVFCSIIVSGVAELVVKRLERDQTDA